MEVDQVQALAHGFPGTPVSDLFPLGSRVLCRERGNRASVIVL